MKSQIMRVLGNETNSDGRVPLGDLHNFGKQVHLNLKRNRIVKPRHVIWEWLLLTAESPIRCFIEEEARRERIPSLFKVMPKLKMECLKGNDFFLDGMVEPLVLQPIGDSTISFDDWEAVGRAIGIVTWFGITDLHKENIFFGLDKDNSLQFGPVDIEDFFDDYYLLSQSHLLPSPKIPFEKSGLGDIYNIVKGDPETTLSILTGFIDAVSFLSGLEDKILTELLKINGIKESRIRVVIRPTSDYYQFLNGKCCDPLEMERSLFPCEIAQIQRGDIPYFFRKLSSDAIYYFKTANKVKEINVPENFKKELLKHSRIINEHLVKRKNMMFFMKAAPLQFVNIFLENIKYPVCSVYKKLKLDLTREKIFIKVGDKFSIYSDRNMSVSCRS